VEQKAQSMNEGIVKRELTLGNIAMFLALVFTSGINYATLTNTQRTHAKELESAATSLSETRAAFNVTQQRLNEELRSLRDVLSQLQINNTMRFTRLETILEREISNGRPRTTTP
jgi:hypothetical protein